MPTDFFTLAARNAVWQKVEIEWKKIFPVFARQLEKLEARVQGHTIWSRVTYYLDSNSNFLTSLISKNRYHFHYLIHILTKV